MLLVLHRWVISGFLFENRISVGCVTGLRRRILSVASASSAPVKMLKNKNSSETEAASNEDLPVKSKLAFELEQVSAMAIANPSQQEFNRMDPYFKQPQLPADFKFMESYFRDYERNWKLVIFFPISHRLLTGS